MTCIGGSVFFFFKQKTAYEMRISDWSSDVCSSDLFTKGILQFNEAFEQAGGRTQAFMKELKELDLLMDGEISIQPEGAERPFIYRGFQMIDEKKLQDMRGDQLRKANQHGMLPLLYAHLFSPPLMRALFGRTDRQKAV